MRLDIIPLSQGRLEFQAILEEAGEHDRYLALLKRPLRRDAAEPIRICSMCKAVRIGEHWKPIEVAAREMELLVHEPMPRLTQSVCENCSFVSRQIKPNT